MDSGNIILTDGADHGARPSRPNEDTAVSAAGIRLFRVLVLAAIATVLVIVVGTVFIIAGLRTQALNASAREGRNLANILAEETDRSLRAAELLEKNLIERMRRLNITSTAEMEQRLSGHDAYLLLKDTAIGVPHVGSVAIIGSGGKPVNSPRFWPLAPFTVVDRDYYKALKSDSELISFLSAPLYNRVDQKRTLYLAHKFVGPDKEFIGLVICGLDLQTFEELFGSVAPGEGVEMALVRTDDTLLAHYPRLAAAAERQDRQGQVFDDAVWVQKQDDTRLLAAQNLPNFPARIVVSIPIAAALADWRTEALYVAGVAALLLIIIGGVAFVTARQFGSYASSLKAQVQMVRTESKPAAGDTAMTERERARRQLEARQLHIKTAIDHIPQRPGCSTRMRALWSATRIISRYTGWIGLRGAGRPLRDIIAYRVAQGGFAATRTSLPTMSSPQSHPESRGTAWPNFDGRDRDPDPADGKPRVGRAA